MVCLSLLINNYQTHVLVGNCFNLVLNMSKWESFAMLEKNPFFKLLMGIYFYNFNNVEVFNNQQFLI